MAILKFSNKDEFDCKINGYRAYLEGEYGDYTNTAKQKIVIPSYYNGVPVIILGRSSAGVREIELVLPDTLETLDSGSLSVINTKKLFIPKSVENIDFLAISNSYIEEVIIHPDNQHFKAEDNIIYSKDGKKLVLYLQSKKDKVFIIPKEVETIESGAFYGSKYIEEVIFQENSVKKINSYAFSHSKMLKKVSIRDGLKEISNYAFSNCDKLEEVYFPLSIKNMGVYLFKKSNKAKLYCSFEEPGEKWPKSWRNKDENVFLGYGLNKDEVQMNNSQISNLSKKISEICKLSNQKESCEKAYEEWFISVNNISDNQFKNDILNSVSVLMLYLTKIDNASVDVGLINELVEKTFSKYKKVLKDLDCLGEKQIQDLINFMLFISKYDKKIYQNTIDLLLKLSLSKGSLSEKQFNFILAIFDEKDLKYDKSWAKNYEDNLQKEDNTISRDYIKNKIKYDKGQSLQHLEIVDGKLKKIKNPESLIHLLLPKEIKEFSKKIFFENKYLKSVKFEEGSLLEAIPKRLFSGCEMLEYVDITKTSIQKIDTDTFLNCHHLKEIIGVEQITYIEKGALFGCEGLLWDYENNVKCVSPTMDYLFEKSKTVWTKKTNVGIMNKYISIRYVSSENTSGEYIYRVPIDFKCEIGDQLMSGDITKKTYICGILNFDGIEQDFFDFDIVNYGYCKKEQDPTIYSLNLILKYFKYDSSIKLARYEKDIEKRILYNMKFYNFDNKEDYLEFEKIRDNESVRNSEKLEYIKNSIFTHQDYLDAKEEFYKYAIIDKEDGECILRGLNYYPETLVIPNDITKIELHALNKCFKTKRLIFEERDQFLKINFDTRTRDCLASLAIIDINNCCISTWILDSCKAEIVSSTQSDFINCVKNKFKNDSFIGCTIELDRNPYFKSLNVLIDVESIKERDLVEFSLYDIKISGKVSEYDIINKFNKNELNKISPKYNCIATFKETFSNNNPTIINSAKLILDRPMIINDDYPFIYEQDIIKQINKARMNDKNSIEFLIERYENENNLIKMNYWKERLRNISK